MTYSLNGIKVATGTRQRVERACLDLLGRGGLVFTVNALMAERARRDAAFLDVLSRADVCTADGFGVAAALALRGIECEPTPGVELGETVATAGPVSLALIGGRAGVGERAFAYLKKKNTGLTSSFILPGYGISEETYLSAIDTSRHSDVTDHRERSFSPSADRSTSIRVISRAHRFICAASGLNGFGEWQRSQVVSRHFRRLFLMPCTSESIREKNPQKTHRQSPGNFIKLTKLINFQQSSCII